MAPALIDKRLQLLFSSFCVMARHGRRAPHGITGPLGQRRHAQLKSSSDRSRSQQRLWMAGAATQAFFHAPRTVSTTTQVSTRSDVEHVAHALVRTPWRGASRISQTSNQPSARGSPRPP